MGKILVPQICAEIAAQPHTLIGGTTGAGKSTLLNSFVHSAALMGGGLILIDPKQTEFKRWLSSGACVGYADSPTGAAKALRYSVELLRKRSKKMQRQGLTLTRDNDVFVVVDELADLIFNADRETIGNLMTIATLGRAEKIHLILATQSPSRATIPAKIAVNLPCRVGLACQNKIESRQVLGVTGAEVLPLPAPSDPNQRRLCLFKPPYLRDPELWQVPYTPPEKIRETVNQTADHQPRFLKRF